MNTDLSERDKTLRIVRFFLPRLSRNELAKEIEDEKNRLRTVSQARVSELRREGENRLNTETGQPRSQLADHEKRRNIDTYILVFAGLAVVAGVAITATMKSALGMLTSLAGAVALILAGVDCWLSANRARSCRNEIKSLESAIRQWMEKEIAEEEVILHDRLTLLDARLDELIRFYEKSIASEDEVVEFCNSRLTELQELVGPALGVHPDDILDERSAEIWAPSFLQFQEFPQPVLRDAAQSEKEIRDWADDIVEPMQAALPNDDQWQAFRGRVLPMLGLCPPQIDSMDPEQNRASGAVSFNSLQAVAFSPSRQTYLAGHYFYQKIVCAEDMIGLFRAYVNILNRRVPHTCALQILYPVVTAIGIETAFNRERFDLSGMTIDQNTHTLTLELSSGTSYRMSGDVGSAAQIESSGDAGAAKVVSQANQVFHNQIINVRALIRDAKALAQGRRVPDSQGVI